MMVRFVVRSGEHVNWRCCGSAQLASPCADFFSTNASNDRVEIVKVRSFVLICVSDICLIDPVAHIRSLCSRENDAQDLWKMAKFDGIAKNPLKNIDLESYLRAFPVF